MTANKKHQGTTGHSATRLAMTLTELPVDAWPAIARCLAGADLFDLARINRWSWRLFSQDDYWCERLTVEDTRGRVDGITTTLKMYMQNAYSFQFQGLSKELAVQGHPAPRGSCAELSSFDVSVIQQFQPFAFDVWFCLLDSRGGYDTSNNNAKSIGGVLFGAQSVSYDDDEWADSQLQFAVVSSDRKLLLGGQRDARDRVQPGAPSLVPPRTLLR